MDTFHSNTFAEINRWNNTFLVSVLEIKKESSLPEEDIPKGVFMKIS